MKAAKVMKISYTHFWEFMDGLRNPTMAQLRAFYKYGIPGGAFRGQKMKSFGKVVNNVFQKYCQEGKHFLHRFGGVSVIDAALWDSVKNRVHTIQIFTDKGREFTVERNEFEAWKLILDYGYGRQYYIPLDKWRVRQIAIADATGSRQSTL